MTAWRHVACFNLPPKLKKQGTTEEDFVRDLLSDESGSVLPARAEEVVAQIRGAAPRSAAADEGQKLGAAVDFEWLEQIKADYALACNQKQSPPDAKKPKDDKSILTQAYGELHKLSIAELKDILRWNRQHMTGNKSTLLTKILDGVLRGRLARCTLCEGGRLKLHDDGISVTCAGAFDEDTKTRVDCQYYGTAALAPRWQPWFEQEPTKEQDFEMDCLIAIAKGETPPSAAADEDPVVQKLIVAAHTALPTLELHNNEGIKKATAAIYQVLLGSNKPIDLPEDNSDAKHKVGAMIAANRSLPMEQIINILVKELGYKDDKDDKQAKKQAALEANVKCAKNAQLVAAFQQLSELYFKEGNRNAGVVNSKVAAALQNLEFEVTEENAMTLGKGAKTKVAGIGEKSAEKIHEFVTSGTIEKLEEKKAALE